ncbi:MAG TPA: thioredoxin-dependent thiol peroxidase [Candidatus Hydrogenedentes bacterium]|nr:thioredoxin-dependent thiol peroxidase [Candidatus Hydrogenedentota bacterium]
MPESGNPAPDFTLPNAEGKKVRLGTLKGKAVVLYFYPKDDTPGCTVEAQGFQAALDEFIRRGAVVLGVSPDNGKSHCKFAEKFGLRFDLLCDEAHAVAEQYGVWVEKNRYGKKYMGIQRATFLIDKAGRIAKVWPHVKPEGHAAEVIEALDALA